MSIQMYYHLQLWVGIWNDINMQLMLNSGEQTLLVSLYLKYMYIYIHIKKKTLHWKKWDQKNRCFDSVIYLTDDCFYVVVNIVLM